jgi:Tyrosinase co-factor MelC1
MPQCKKLTKARVKGARLIAVCTVVGALAVAGPAGAAVDATAAPHRAKPAAGQEYAAAFYEKYHGHQIMGWGHGASACAYIDGTQLVLSTTRGGWYTSAVVAFQPARGVRAITMASVRALGDLKLTRPKEAVPHCPAFGAPRTGNSLR